MANWYGVKNPQGKIVSYTSDDAQGYGTLPPGFTYVGPYPSQDAAIAALKAQQL